MERLAVVGCIHRTLRNHTFVQGQWSRLIGVSIIADPLAPSLGFCLRCVPPWLFFDTKDQAVNSTL